MIQNRIRLFIKIISKFFSTTAIGGLIFAAASSHSTITKGMVIEPLTIKETGLLNREDATPIEIESSLSILSAIDELINNKEGYDYAANTSFENTTGVEAESEAEADSDRSLVDGEPLELGELVAQTGNNTKVKRSKKKNKTATKNGTKKKTNKATPAAQKRPVSRAKKSRAVVRDPKLVMLRREEDRGRQAVRRGDYFEASKIFFGLLNKEKNPLRLLQIRFILGRTLQELKLHQVAVFPYYEIIRSEGKSNPKNKYVRQSLERLTVAADALESDVLINYAVKQINEDDFPAPNRDMLYFRRGEVRLRDRDYVGAVREFNRVRGNSTYYNRARYMIGLSLAENGQLDKAENVFGSLAEINSDRGATNSYRVNALMGRARTLYQRKLFSDAVDAYREIPRDTEQWHDALFESTWALLQDGRFRSALSNFHSLHSPFYDDFYQPESLLLRAIVYHYICRYDDMEATLRLFERVYKPVQNKLQSTLSMIAPSSSVALYQEVRKIDEQYDAIKKATENTRLGKMKLQVPFLVARQVLREGDVRRNIAYIKHMESEKSIIAQASPQWRESRVGRYASRVLDRRIVSTQQATGRLIRKNLETIQKDLAEQFEQAGLVRLDMLSGKKEAVKKEIAGKGLLRDSVDENQDRSFFIQNGYDFWPFQGEYWLDEIGNYHYLGVKACE